MRRVVKPPALSSGANLAIVWPASPTEPARIEAGVRELARLGYSVACAQAPGPLEGYFAAAEATRARQLQRALEDSSVNGIIFARGGYGSAPLLEQIQPERMLRPKVLVGFSDITALQIYIWQKIGWVSFYGPMVGAGLDLGADNPGGYDQESFMLAARETRAGWSLALHGEAFVAGEAEGVLLGGCLTLLETTLGTPWELETAGAILVLEDRGMKPYQVDRALVHLRQAGKLSGVRGIVLGEFPADNPAETNGVTVQDVCQRILSPLGVPVVWGAPIGHTSRPMLTLPLGVRARLSAGEEPRLVILEPAVSA